MSHRRATGTVQLPPETLAKVRALVAEHGETHARALAGGGVSRETWGRAIGGLRIQRGSVALIERGLRSLRRSEAA